MKLSFETDGFVWHWRGCLYGDPYSAWEIMHRFAWWKLKKNVPKFGHSEISQSQITISRNRQRYGLLASSQLHNEIAKQVIFTQLTRILIWNISMSLKIIKLWFTKLTSRNISYLHIFAFIFCVDLVTMESLWRHKGVVMHLTPTSFSKMHSSPPASELANFGFAIYQNHITRVSTNINLVDKWHWAE